MKYNKSFSWKYVTQDYVQIPSQSNADKESASLSLITMHKHNNIIFLEFKSFSWKTETLELWLVQFYLETSMLTRIVYKWLCYHSYTAQDLQQKSVASR